MAIVHVSMKASSQAPPAAAHAQYIARDGQYERRGGVELVESGNMPEFARENPQAFWQAADDFERANGRTYRELQIALPRELSGEQRIELAREATREFLGDRFAYTMAVHTPLAKDNIEQPHMHLMFSERTIDDRTRELPEEQFFKRNGAKKNRDWTTTEKLVEVREKWVETMNAAMERQGHEQRLDHRSWEAQGRPDLAELVEPKLLGGNEAEARALHAQVDELRERRAELPAPGLSAEKVIDQWEQQAERQVAEVREREAQELSRLDKLIAAARELAQEVKEKAVAVTQNVAERVEQLRGQYERWRESRGENAERIPDVQQRPPAQDKGQERAGPELASSPEIERGRQTLRERYEAYQKERQPEAAPESKPEKDQEQKQERQISRGFGIGM